VYLLDTWAWVEYFDGTPAGARVQRILESATVATSILSVAELSDLYTRRKSPTLDEKVEFVRGSGQLLDLDLRAVSKAGLTKWTQRARKHPMGLGNAVIYETARANGLTVVTGDPGFKGLPGVEFLD
jgi:predicted nucleic acid-binding protein